MDLDHIESGILITTPVIQIHAFNNVVDLVILWDSGQYLITNILSEILINLSILNIISFCQYLFCKQIGPLLTEG